MFTHVLHDGSLPSNSHMCNRVIEQKSILPVLMLGQVQSALFIKSSTVVDYSNTYSDSPGQQTTGPGEGKK